jgi:Lipocalin-like domain
MIEVPVLSRLIVGTWEVITRIDRTQDGREVEEPSLGRDPVAVIMFDANGRFAAQFMKRSLTSIAEPPVSRQGAPNNTRAVGGYDAYFGSYKVDDDSGLVTVTLAGALSRENVGMVLEREIAVEGDQLVIRVPTATAEGVPVLRTLTCRRAS